MVREDLVDGAVTFLQDPSVSSAPLEQKVSFLRSKNLTQEEIDASLARVGQSPPAQAPAYNTQNYSSQFRQPPPQYNGGYQQQQYPPWSQPPPELPRRDWRDWFIMATVVGGVGYAAYWTAKRYIYPLIAPPTPPQLEQDKASIDASFEKAFALLEQLATDTQELKDSEAERKQRMDHALAEVESVIGKMKEANETRELEAKRMARELDDIKEQIPQAIQKDRETTDGRLKDLAVEMKSLKTLVSNRMGGGGGGGGGVASTVPPRTSPSFSAPTTNGINGGSAPAVQSPEVKATNGVTEDTSGEKSASSVLPERPASSSPYGGRTLGGKAQIPSWQLAAKKKAEDAKNETTTNGSQTGGGDGGSVSTAVDAVPDA